VLTSGTYTLSVQFTPSSPNYAAASATTSITVGSAMGFTGFFTPVRNMPYINAVSAGSAIPMKFSLPGYRGSQVLRGMPASMPVQCSADIALGPTETHAGTLQSSMGNNYTFVWKTNSGWAGTCRKFVLTLSDGSTHKALFRFAPAPRAQILKRVVNRR
jgi:hypothetical protein